MGYKAVYENCHKADVHVPRMLVRDQVLAATGVNKIPVMMTTLDTTKCRGFYLSAKNTDHPFVKQHGGHVIVLARGMNRCWTRFVMVKELMHLFDTPEQATDSGEDFDNLLAEFMVPSEKMSPQMRSELVCFWKALGVLCPEAQRQAFIKDRERLDDYAIALRLRIPQLYVPPLFSDRYRPLIDSFMD